MEAAEAALHAWPSRKVHEARLDGQQRRDNGRLITDRAFHKALRRAPAHQRLEQDQLAVGVVGDARWGDRPPPALAVDVARRFMVTRAVGPAPPPPPLAALAPPAPPA